MNLLQCTNACRASRADTRRQHLLDTARALFIAHGFHGAGVAQLAAASGVRVGQIYRDFASKEEIIAALVEADLGSFLDEAGLRAAVEQGDAAAIRGWIGRFVEADEPIEECRLMTEIVAESARNERIAAIHGAIDARIRGLLILALTALLPGEELGGGRSRIADLVMMLSIGMSIRRIADPALDLASLGAQVSAIIDREIAELRAGTVSEPA